MLLVVSFVHTLFGLGLTVVGNSMNVSPVTVSLVMIVTYQLNKAPLSVLVLFKILQFEIFYLFQAAHISLCSIKGASVCLWIGWSWPAGD